MSEINNINEFRKKIYGANLGREWEEGDFVGLPSIREETTPPMNREYGIHGYIDSPDDDFVNIVELQKFDIPVVDRALMPESNAESDRKLGSRAVNAALGRLVSITLEEEI